MSLATYNALPQEDKNSIDNLLNIARPLAADIAKLCSTMESILLDYNQNVVTLITAMANEDEIPNNTNLNDAQKITKSDVVDFMAGLSNVTTTYNTSTRRARWIKMAGLNASIG